MQGVRCNHLIGKVWVGGGLPVKLAESLLSGDIVVRVAGQRDVDAPMRFEAICLMG